MVPKPVRCLNLFQNLLGARNTKGRPHGQSSFAHWYTFLPHLSNCFFPGHGCYFATDISLMHIIDHLQTHSKLRRAHNYDYCWSFGTSVRKLHSWLRLLTTLTLFEATGLLCHLWPALLALQVLSILSRQRTTIFSVRPRCEQSSVSVCRASAVSAAVFEAAKSFQLHPALSHWPESLWLIRSLQALTL